MQSVSFLLGSDPELFLRDTETKELKSAIPVIPEGKGAGRMIGRTGNSVLHDNVLIEFNTEPACSEKEFVRTIGKALKGIQNIVSKDGLELHLQASADFPKSELNCEEAIMFGCEPDYGSYPPRQNFMPADAAEKPFRSAGGHLHIGMPEDNEEVQSLLSDPMGKIAVVKALDIFVGVVGVMLDDDPTSTPRRELYGKAGSHRPKEYGVEYRACSPWWLASPKHTSLIYNLSESALATALDADNLENLISAIGGETELQEIVNGADYERAQGVYDEHIAPLLSNKTKKLVEELKDETTTELSKAWGL